MSRERILDAVSLGLGFIMVFGIVFVAQKAHAEAIEYTCSDFNQGESSSCVGDVMNLSSGGYRYSDFMTNWNQGSTVYVSFVVEGTGSGETRFWGNANVGASETFTDGEYVALPLTLPTGNSSWGWQFHAGLGDGDFVGSVTGFCVTDTEGECEAGPEPEPSATSTISTLDQSQQNLFNGFMLFLLSMFFGIWLWRRN